MIAFEQQDDGTWRGAGMHGRVWVLSQVLTGWRLQFIDTDGFPINSGIYATLEAAKAGAGPGQVAGTARR